MSDAKVKYLRTLKNPRVLRATEILLANREFYPCDEKGLFLNTASFQMGTKTPSPEGPAQIQYNLEVLRARAKELKISGYNNAKVETLVSRIEAREIELAAEAKAIELQAAKELSEANAKAEEAAQKAAEGKKK